MPIDDIIFCDTGMEFPYIYIHIKEVENYINRKITILKPNKSFEYYMFEHEITRGKNKGRMGYGWPSALRRWCTTILKQKVMDTYRNKYEDVICYVGIATDEENRAKKFADFPFAFPLIDWGVTEFEALKYCYKKGFYWDGLYEHFDRVSCWCCPLKSLHELKMLYNYYPMLWNKLKEMDSKSFNKFKHRYGVAELGNRFQQEDMQMNISNLNTCAKNKRGI